MWARQSPRWVRGEGVPEDHRPTSADGTPAPRRARVGRFHRDWTQGSGVFGCRSEPTPPLANSASCLSQNAHLPAKFSLRRVPEGGAWLSAPPPIRGRGSCVPASGFKLRRCLCVTSARRQTSSPDAERGGEVSSRSWLVTDFCEPWRVTFTYATTWATRASSAMNSWSLSSDPMVSTGLRPGGECSGRRDFGGVIFPPVNTECLNPAIIY